MKLVVGNMKMNIVTRRDRDRYIQSLRESSRKNVFKGTCVVLCPPFVHLENFSKSLPRMVELGAQDAFWERKGSFTGEISPLMLKEFECSWVILGHSERRVNLGETNQMVHRKVAAALENGLRVVLCIGETGEQRRAGDTLRVLEWQLHEALCDVAPAKIAQMAIAYEPVWSIGTGLTPEATDIAMVREFIRNEIVQIYGSALAKECRILYGGSVSSANTRMVCVDTGMDGVLVGRESLQPEELMRIAQIVDGG